MAAYWVYFLIPLIGVLSPIVLKGKAKVIGWCLLFSASVLFLGFRSEVGGDWDNYWDFAERVAGEEFSFVYQSKDPGYVFLNWLSGKIGWGIYGVNFLSALIFIGCLTVFCLRQPLPLLAWLIATPYLIIVVGMGYTRQSIAIGLAMVAITQLEKKYVWRFLGLIAFAATFHKSAVLLSPLCLVQIDRKILQRFQQIVKKEAYLSLVIVSIVLLFVCGAIYVTIKSGMFTSEFRSYVLLDTWHSEGGMLRAVMNVAPAILLLICHRQWIACFGNVKVWYGIAVMAIAVLLATPYISTFADRMGLYSMVIQIYVLSRIPLLVKSNVFSGGLTVAIAGLYATVLFVWLNYAAHAYHWVPYQGAGLF
jgi:hypothetical protein